jgi:hypothetical protein
MNIPLTFDLRQRFSEDSIDFGVVKERLAEELMGLGRFRLFIVQSSDDEWSACVLGAVKQIADVCRCEKPIIINFLILGLVLQFGLCW